VENECGSSTIEFPGGRGMVTRVALVSDELALVTIARDEAVPPGVTIENSQRYAAEKVWDCLYRRTNGRWREDACRVTLVF